MREILKKLKKLLYKIVKANVRKKIARELDPKEIENLFF